MERDTYLDPRPKPEALVSCLPQVSRRRSGNNEDAKKVKYLRGFDKIEAPNWSLTMRGLGRPLDEVDGRAFGRMIA